MTHAPGQPVPGPHVLVVYTDDEPGVLTRVASLIRRRGFNIHSLTVGPTERAGLSRMTIVVDSDAQRVRQAVEHLRKLVNVLEVQQLGEGPSVVRDLVLLRVATAPAVRAEVLQLAQVFRAAVVDIAEDSVVIECTGSLAKIDALVDSMRPFGILEMGRTGAVAMARGTRTVTKAKAAVPLRTGTSPEAMSV
ncbi:MAG TPA: acetolactate synthase small subunit [Geothrix sp.]|nr:acetolactate synthase small subunit [Geothrix sp.]